MKSTRIESIDLLRGIVMVIMALDHVRAFFHYDAYFFDPSDLSQTNGALFFTRFITHYCAPVFVFLAGTSAYLVGQRKGKKNLSIWLVKRGIWLIIVELTLVQFAWQLQLDYSINMLQVIWVLGASMLFLAVFIHIPKKAMIAISLIAIFGHNLLDGFTPETWSSLWRVFHVPGPFTTYYGTFFIAYPLIPWIFVMPLGYHLGRLYNQGFDHHKRKSILIYMGVSMVGLFIAIRGINIYGDPNLWSISVSVSSSILSFMSVTKYPPSLLFLLITLGPAILLLAFLENWKGRMSNAILIIGRVPMFFYIIHIYVIHLFALLAAVSQGFSAKLMIIDVFISMTHELQGFGFNLWVVYVLWALLSLGLFPICKWYWNYKNDNRDKWWLSYL